ncbi:hypothetical protein GWI33_002026 [Rhynchophorus ferrugineus]|uniref:Uncharacterized protein n=1 Tax=Rhynchophorus ferrugineus TaxID=354439 RepID=A0A834MNA4_RHYFE|nr:hypothetical protein GWI33_002026 [Rhynchophorus ferrugineus]
MHLFVRPSLLFFAVIIPELLGNDHNETVQNQSADDPVDSSSVITGNSSGNLLFVDRTLESTSAGSVATDTKNKVETNTRTDFRPSPLVETSFEYNKSPVIPAHAEGKTIGSSITVDRGSDQGRTTLFKTRFQEPNISRSAEIDVPRLVDGFEPGYSAFGRSGSYSEATSVNVDDASKRLSCIPCYLSQNEGIVAKNSPTSWTNKVKFPTSYPSSYPTQTFSTQTKTFPQSVHQDLPHNELELSVEASPPTERPILQRFGDFFHGLTSNTLDFSHKPSYSATGFGSSAEEGGKYLPPSGPPRQNTEFNFNKPVKVPERYSPATIQPPSHQKTFDTFYNLMERPPTEHTHGQHPEKQGLSYNPWKKVLKLLATFVPIGLLISALTPTVITVTNVNDTNTPMQNRYRSNEDSKRELKDRIVSSLEYFDQLNAGGCEYRVFCELLVTASHMDQADHHVNNLLDAFSKENIDIKSQAKELKKVFEAVAREDCSGITCDFIKKSK